MACRAPVIVAIVLTMFLRWNRRVVAFLPTKVTATWVAAVHRPNSMSGCSRHCRLFSQTSDARLPSTTFPNVRAQILHEQLTSIGVNADGIMLAALRSIEDPTTGYDSDFGKSAIRTYRAFVYPKKGILDDQGDQNPALSLKAAAGRTARQMDFLIKRHQSHQTEWVRHHDVIRDRRQIFPLILVLDNVRSAFNVGSLYRTADAAGCQAVYTCGITPHPNGNGADKLSKSALGAELVLDTRHFGSTREAIEYLRESQQDFTIVGMETTEYSRTYTDVDYNMHPKVALVLGNEVTGVDTTILSELDQIVEIPTFGAKNSLNVAACAPIVLYEIIRQWKA